MKHKGNTPYKLHTWAKQTLTLLCAFLLALQAHATLPPVDTARVYDIEEAIVTAQPKEHSHLRVQPVSASVFGTKDLASYHVQAPKGLSVFAPNLYMPRYGSRLTSAVYVRGVGSRSGYPAVGLYVDGQPFADKSAYDFRFMDVVRADLLRGPQGTLYGRGAMGGLLRVFTADPFQTKGTDVRLGLSGRNTGRHIAATTYLHPSQTVALSVGAFYDGVSGFWRNTSTGSKADGSHAAGLKTRAAWQANQRLRFDLTASYQYSNEDCNPYVYDGPAGGAGTDAYPTLRGQISQNRQSAYKRNLFTTALTTTWHARNGMTLTNVAAYQYLRDRLFMDQDYLRADIFSLEQRQRSNSFTDEFTLKGQSGHWKWTSGAFYLYEKKHTTCPVNFYGDGMTFLNGTFRTVMPSFITLTLQDPGMELNATLDAPSHNVAFFHESTLTDVFMEGLNLTAGLRLDYDQHSLTLASPPAPVHYNFLLDMPATALHIDHDFESNAGFSGHASQHSWQLLPKFSVSYELAEKRGLVYLTAAKGYRSGGFNLENYSDLAQAVLRRNMMLQVKAYSEQTINALPLSDEQKEKAIAGMSGMIGANLPPQPNVGSLAYTPERCWNYEMGTHLSFLDGALRLDAALFWLQTRGLQLSKFAASGLGRIIENAGRSRTLGAELTVRSAMLDNRLNLSAAYGLAHSRFTAYDLGNGADYTGNQVPFAPRHTLALTADFRQPTVGFVRAYSFGATLTGAGRIQWDEANTFSQPFYARLNAHAGIELKGDVSIDVWARNITRTRYSTFSFESMNRRFYQQGTPFHVGLDVAWHF